MWASPISPSISARGTNAATESTVMISTAPLRTSVSAISSACSPVSGCETRRSSVWTPSFFAYPRSRACSASINAATPPAFCASAITCKESVVLPEASGPKISITRPRGKPPTPSARSSPNDPDEMAGTSAGISAVPSLMMAPFPYCFSIWESAKSSARFLSSFSIVRSAIAPSFGLRNVPLYSTHRGKHSSLIPVLSAERKMTNSLPSTHLEWDLPEPGVHGAGGLEVTSDQGDGLHPEATQALRLCHQTTFSQGFADLPRSLFDPCQRQMRAERPRLTREPERVKP